jgi:hypothetical protein
VLFAVGVAGGEVTCEEWGIGRGLGEDCNYEKRESPRKNIIFQQSYSKSVSI